MDTVFYGNSSGVPEGVQLTEEQPRLEPQSVIGEKEVIEAASILNLYKQGKMNLEARVREDELWWELRHWEAIRKKGDSSGTAKPVSAWLHNMLVNKHADAMDNYPEPAILPRERSDEESARQLSAIIPVVMEHNRFEQTYREAWWEKLKHGTAVYSVLWDSNIDNGLGDVSIRSIDLMKIFWEPGITDIQASRNVFVTELVDTDILDEMYPEHAHKMKGGNIDITEYAYDDNVDTSGKSVVVDWYYRKNVNGRTVLHYCKFCNREVLYASENDPQYAESGFYDHGMYPFVFDTLYPEKGTPVGFGFIAICKEAQLYIDQLSANILESSMMCTKKRFFISDSTAINEDEFLDWSKPFVHVAGEIGEQRIQEIVCAPLNGIYQQVLQSKIEEMKDTSTNKDVNSGGTASGVTAASAISALQEAGNKSSRDMIQQSYNSYQQIVTLVIELMRQFYTETRVFRVTQANESEYTFEDFSSEKIGYQQTGIDQYGNPLMREPVFDIKVKAQKRNPFSVMSANQTAQQLYQMGFFLPDKAQESSIALSMMEFEGIDKVRDAVSEGNTLKNMVSQLQQVIARLTGVPPMDGSTPQIRNGNPIQGSVQEEAARAQTPMTPYGQRLASRSNPNMAAQAGSRTEPN